MTYRLMKIGLCGFSLFIFSNCGLYYYPGQPGIVTNDYSKIDMEFLDFEGLWVYEVSYDNRGGGNKVGAILTKLYPDAETFTSNARTNSHGTLYWTKAQHKGAVLQMVSVPRIQQVMLPPDSRVWLYLWLDESENENDLINIAEQGMFNTKTRETNLSAHLNSFQKLRWDLLRAGRLDVRGKLNYEVTSVQFGDKTYTPVEPVVVETNLFQNGARVKFTPTHKVELISFIQTHFPKGYKGKVNFMANGLSQPVTVPLTVNTLETLKASGYTVIENARAETIEEALRKAGV